MFHYWRIPGLASGVIAAALASGAWAQPQRSITVVAEGVSSTAPDFVVIKGNLPGRGDTSGAARKAFEGLKTALEKEFPPGGGLAGVAFRGERFATAAATGMEAMVVAVPGGAAVAPESKPVEISENVDFRIEFGSDMERDQVGEKVAAVIDRAAKLGVAFVKPMNAYSVLGRQAPAVTEFGIDKPNDAATKACEAAVKDARSKAERLAAAAGGSLGDIVTIEELDPKAATDAYSQILMMSMGETPSGSEFTSDSNRPVEVRRRLRVTFEYNKK